MDTKDYVYLSGIAVLLVSLGVSVLPDDTHYSVALNRTAHCDRLSSSGLTCYPYPSITTGRIYSPTPWLPITRISEPEEVQEEIVISGKSEDSYYIYLNGERYFKLADEKGMCLKNGLTSQKVSCP